MSPYDRFLSKVHPEPNSGCWFWLGASHRQGYGQFYLHPTVVLAHRASWFFHKGRMPAADEVVCHACDNPACVNPDHLWLGRTIDNVRDAFAKGRMKREGRRGEKNNCARLTLEHVATIRLRLRKPKVYAAEYGVSVSTIYAVLSGANWAA